MTSEDWVHDPLVIIIECESYILICMLVIVILLMINSPLCSGNYSWWVVYGDITMSMLILMSFLYPTLAYVVGELCILASWWLWSCSWFHVQSLSHSGNDRNMWVCIGILVTGCAHHDDFMFTLYSTFSTIVCELCVLASWWLWSCLSHVLSPSYSGIVGELYSSMLVAVVTLMIPCWLLILLWQS